MVDRRTGVDEGLTQLTVTQAVAVLHSGESTVSDYVRACVRRYEQTRYLNAVITMDVDALLEGAERLDRTGPAAACGPFWGLPVVLKDNINTGSLPTSACTPALKANRPPGDAPVARRLRDAGALLFGKANMHELAFGITNNHGAFGAARNPYAPDSIPGGSSGGTAAAVAARVVPAGLGTDTGGSVRIPAALCGICGFRPSAGRYSNEGIVPISRTRDTAGPMARSVRDLAVLDRVLSADGSPLPQVQLGSLRLGVPRRFYYEDLEPALSEVVERLLARLADAGVTLVEQDITDIGILNDRVSMPVALYEARRDMIAYLAASAPGVSIEQLAAHIVSADVRSVYQAVLDGPPDRQAYESAMQQHRPALQTALTTYFRRHRLDALLIPTTPLTATPIGDDDTVLLNGRRRPTMGTFIRNLDPSSNAGIPSLSIPAGMAANGRPVGICIEGPARSDGKVLAIGMALEACIDPLPAPRGGRG